MDQEVNDLVKDGKQFILHYQVILWNISLVKPACALIEVNANSFQLTVYLAFEWGNLHCWEFPGKHFLTYPVSRAFFAGCCVTIDLFRLLFGKPDIHLNRSFFNIVFSGSGHPKKNEVVPSVQAV